MKIKLNSDVKRRISDTGVELLFIPGKDFLFELNETASIFLEMTNTPISIDEVVKNILNEYDIDDIETLRTDIGDIVERMLEHDIILEQK